MIGRTGFPELLILFVIILLVFGVGRITKVAGELGSGIRAFKSGLQGDKEEEVSKSNEETRS